MSNKNKNTNNDGPAVMLSSPWNNTDVESNKVDSNESGSATRDMVATVIRLPSEESTDFQLVTSVEMARQAGLAKPLKAHQVMRFLIRKNRNIQLDNADIQMLRSIVAEDKANRKTRAVKA